MTVLTTKPPQIVDKKLEPFTESIGNALATRIEIIAEDLAIPIEARPWMTPGADPEQVVKFRVVPTVSATWCQAGQSPATAASAIAEQFDAWSKQFAQIAAEIRKRFA